VPLVPLPVPDVPVPVPVPEVPDPEVPVPFPVRLRPVALPFGGGFSRRPPVPTPELLVLPLWDFGMRFAPVPEPFALKLRNGGGSLLLKGEPGGGACKVPDPVDPLPVAPVPVRPVPEVPEPAGAVGQVQLSVFAPVPALELVLLGPKVRYGGTRLENGDPGGGACKVLVPVEPFVVVPVPVDSVPVPVPVEPVLDPAPRRPVLPTVPCGDVALPVVLLPVPEFVPVPVVVP